MAVLTSRSFLLGLVEAVQCSGAVVAKVCQVSCLSVPRALLEGLSDLAGSNFAGAWSKKVIITQASFPEAQKQRAQ